MTKLRCVKGWNDIGHGRSLRTTEYHHLYVSRTMGGRYLAEVIRKRHSMADDANFFDDEHEARAWSERIANVRPPRPKSARPWWHDGSS